MKLLTNDIKPILNLAIPFALTGLVQCAPWFFETLFLAQLGKNTLAAGALVSWLFATIAVIMFGILSAINILVSHKHGANDKKGIAAIAHDGIVQAVILTVPTLFIIYNMASIFRILGQSESVVLLAQSYLHALAWGILPNLLQIALLEVFIGLGRTRTILIFSIITVTLNIIFSYVLIFGKYGFPSLGIAGAGYGMTASNWLSLAILVSYIVINKSYHLYFIDILTLNKTTFFIELFHIGVPMGIMYCVEVSFFFALTLAMGLLDTTIQASNQVVLQYLGLIASTMFAISQAITVRMGHLLGSKNTLSAGRAGHIGVLLAVTLASFISFLYLIDPRVFISIILNIQNPANFGMIEIIKKLMIPLAIFQIIESGRIAYFGSLRAIKETKFVMFISILSFWVIALPVGYFIAIYLNVGASGFWWGMIMGASASVFLLRRRFNLKIQELL